LGSYAQVRFPKVFCSYALGLGGLPKSPGNVAIALRSGFSWEMSRESTGKGSGKGS
jgi:hypothetical protein